MTTTALVLHLNNRGGRATTFALDGRVGSPGIPMFAHVATPAFQCQTYAGPEATTTGIVCGVCTEGFSFSERFEVRHASVDHVHECSALGHELEAIARDEAPLVRAGIL
jgi:hypothetical protein